MNQVLQILRKDMRHVWIELSLVLGITVYFIYCEWLTLNPPFDQPWYIEPFPGILLLLSWWIFAVRVVHEEVLVGDRQFWVTRPYDWRALLVAKLLLIYATITIPLFVAESWLTWKSGYSPITNVGTILAHVLFSPVLATLPLIVLAALTRKLAHWLTAVLGAAICVALLAWASSHADRAALQGLSELPGNLQMLSFFGLAIAALLVQYARRRMLVSWALLLVGVIGIVVIMFSTPYERMIENTFTEVDASATVFQLAAGKQSPEARATSLSKKEVFVPLTTHVGGVPEGIFVSPVGTRITVETADGFHWRSEWASNYAFGTLFSGESDKVLNFAMDAAAYEHVKDKKAHVRLTVAWIDYKYFNAVRIVADERFMISRVGICWLRSGYEPISCRAISNNGTPFVMEVRSDEITCDSRDRAPSGLVAHYLNNDSISESWDAVHLRSVFLFDWDHTDSSEAPKPTICPGTPLYISRPVRISKHQTEFDLGEMTIPELRVVKGGNGVAIGIGAAR